MQRQPSWSAPTRSVPRETLTLAAGVHPRAHPPPSSESNHGRACQNRDPNITAPLAAQALARPPAVGASTTCGVSSRRPGSSRPGRSPTLIADPLTAGGPVEDEPSRRPGARPRRPDPEHCRSPGRERRGTLPGGLSDAGEERPEDRDAGGVRRAGPVGLPAKDHGPHRSGHEINVHNWPERRVRHEGRDHLVEACLATRSASRRRVLLRRLRGCTCGAVDQGASGHADGEGAQQT